MKKIITLAVLSLMLLGCEESGSPNSTKVLIPAPDPAPIVNPAPAFKAVTIQLNTSEPTQYQIRIERYVEGVGYDSANPVLINGTTSQQIVTHSFQLEYKCRFSFVKMQSANPLLLNTFLDAEAMTSQSLGSNSGSYALEFTDPVFFN
jgi:hypothetical protein